MRLRNALIHPVALVVALGSIAIAAAVAVIAPWSDSPALLLLWGLLVYALVVATVAIRGRLPPATPMEEPAPRTEADLVAMTEDALRRLNNPPALASCVLAGRLPRLLGAVRVADSANQTPAATPLEQAQALRHVLVAAIDRLRSADAAAQSEVEALHYVVLHEEYVLGRPNTQVMARHHISESTFHRYRREGIRVLAAELERQEQLVSKQ